MSQIGNLDSALSTALNGIQRELKSAAENATKIANISSESSDGDLASPVLDLKEDLRQVKALRKVVNTTEEMQDEVLNIIA